MRVFGPDLKPLWSHPASFGSPADNRGLVATAMPAAAGRPGLVIMSNGLVWNGPDGRRLGLGPRGTGDVRKQVRYLESHDPRRPLFWIVDDGRETVCYRMMPDTPERDPGAAGRTPGPPAADPRWQRPLPWAIPIVETIGPRGFVTMIVLALVNLAIPLGLLKFAARRRPWTTRLLLALPIAAAVPLSALSFFAPLIDAQIGKTMFAAGVIYIVATLAGATLLAFAGATAWSLIRLRWKRLLAITALLLVSSAAAACVWIAYDIRTMPPPGHYGRSEWALVLVPGVAVAGSLILLGWILRRPMRWLRQLRRMASPS